MKTPVALPLSGLSTQCGVPGYLTLTRNSDISNTQDRKGGKFNYQLTNKSLHNRQKPPDPGREDSNSLSDDRAEGPVTCQPPPGSRFCSQGQ